MGIDAEIKIGDGIFINIAFMDQNDVKLLSYLGYKYNQGENGEEKLLTYDVMSGIEYKNSIVVSFGNNVQTINPGNRRALILTDKDLDLLKPENGMMDFYNKEAWKSSYEPLLMVLDDNEDLRSALIDEIVNREYKLNLEAIDTSSLDRHYYDIANDVNLDEISEIPNVYLTDDEKVIMTRILSDKRYTKAGTFIFYVIR